ncbi:MAG: hypothetical protein AB1499_06765, partial [Nitrospirota bacterium]
FSIFLSNLDKKLIVNKEDFSVNKNALAITPFVERIKNRQQQGMQHLSEFYEKHKDKLASTNVINIESISLFKTCENIGMLLDANAKKTRRAYEQALKGTGGNTFECNRLMVMVEK